MISFRSQDAITLAQDIKYPVPVVTGRQAVPTVLTEVPSSSGKAGVIFQFTVINKNDFSVDVTIQDGDGVSILPGSTIEAKSVVTGSFPVGEEYSGGLFWQAASTNVLGSVTARRSY
jgi:hypothetical protein